MVVLLFTIGIIPLTINAENISEDLNINWENSGDITFLVPSDQWFQFGIGINSTSTNTQSIIIEIIGDTNWGINESIFEIKGNELSLQETFELTSQESTNLNVKILIPEIQNGMPLAETEYQFRLKLSNSTGATEFWNYAISILPKYSLSVDELMLNPNIDPLGTVTHEIKIRNTGNILTQFTSEISPLDSDGNLILTNETNRFEKSGWNATLSGWIEGMTLAPNESNTFRIIINAPYASIGNLSTRLHIESNPGTVSENIFVNTTILTIKKSEIQLTDTGCEQFVFENSCKLNLKITNKGNFIENLQNTNCTTNSSFINFNNEFSVIENNLPQQIQLTDSDSKEVFLEPNEFTNIEFEIIFESTGILVEAGTIGHIECNYISDELITIDSSKINITIEDIFDINHDLNPDTWIEENQLFISMNLENKGNLPESFTVTISVSHEGNHGLILPENASYDDNSIRIRAYELLEIEPYEHLNVTGWMDIPSPNIEDEVVWISIEVSTYSNSFEKTWKTNMTINGIGSSNESIKEGEKGFNFDELKNTFNVYGYSILAILIATIMIYNALKIRSERNKLETYEKPIKNKDWMSTFFMKKNKDINVDSPSMNKDEFKQMFTKKVGNKKIEEIINTDKNILKEASNTIDKIKKEDSPQNKNKFIEGLLDDINLEDEEYDY